MVGLRSAGRAGKIPSLGKGKPDLNRLTRHAVRLLDLMAKREGCGGHKDLNIPQNGSYRETAAEIAARLT